MHLETLSLINFKNIKQSELHFSPSINGLVGDNGAGKSNILDAIYFLSMCRSELHITDAQCIRHDSDFFVIEGSYRDSNNAQERIACSYTTKDGKTRALKKVKRNGKEYERLSEHMGLVPVVVVSPHDYALISDTAEERRRFLNILISQFDYRYLAALMQYNSLIAQRNKLLKGDFRGADKEQMLHIYDRQLIPNAYIIRDARARAVEKIIPLVRRYYHQISDGREHVSLEYKSQLDSPHNLEELLLQARSRDIINGHTTVGVHRDDLQLTIDGYALRKYGSQGQQKSFLIALKLAQYQLIYAEKGEAPLLLLDDLFDKLDRSRVEQLLRLVAGDEFGQIFITDCNQERLDLMLKRAEVEYSIFKVRSGKVKEEEL